MKKMEKPVLAEGEVTGHAHVLKGDVAVFQDGDIKTFANAKPTVITHQEHHEVKLPPNQYDSDKVVEFDYVEKVSRKAQD
jgi:hypothetical protein